MAERSEDGDRGGYSRESVTILWGIREITVWRYAVLPLCGFKVDDIPVFATKLHTDQLGWFAILPAFFGVSFCLPQDHERAVHLIP